MRKVAAWGLAATLAMGLGVTVARAADDTPDGKSSAWTPTWQWKPFAGWFGAKDDKKSVDKKPAAKAETATKKPSAPVKPASMVHEAVVERSREESILLRRLQACDKLKEIALRTNDNGLLRRAEELEERAQAAYAQRTVHLRDDAASFESDEKALERHLGASTGRADDAHAYAVNGKDRSRQAAVKEVEP